MNNNIALILVLFLSCSVYSQVQINFIVKDSLLNKIIDAHVLVGSKMKLTDANGIAQFSLKEGAYLVKIQHLIYKNYTKKILLTKDKNINIVLQENTELLQEVVLTSKEKEGITATSVIDRKAMSHLQPTSFADLMSLLPGKSANSPILNYSNHLTIREVGIRSSNYNTSSLGVSYIIDDIPINSNANLQETVGMKFRIDKKKFGTTDGKRNTITRGVDMRSISTDDIEKVEIIRGVSSAEYGDLSSGLIKIIRKKGKSKWNSRIKSDGFSKLVYAGKGFMFEKQNINLNIGLDYLDAKPDPRNIFENYKRYTTSIRVSKEFDQVNPIVWDFNIDYTGTIDKEKTDPETGYKKEDSYESSHNNIRLSNKLNIDFPKGFLSNINLKTSINYSHDEIKQQRRVHITNVSSEAINREAGEFYGIYLDSNYDSNLLIDGKPLDIYTDLSSVFKFDILNAENNLVAGVNYSYSKNKGLGQVYDMKTPPSQGMSLRPRAFSNIPAIKSLAFYLEETSKWQLGETKITLQAGVRGNSLVDMDKNYEIANKIYLDPRINFKVDLPRIRIKNNKKLAINISIGYGEHNKLPTLSVLYPQDSYYDYQQLNYFHTDKNYRQVHYKTYVFPRINYNIKPVLNIKKEVRFGFKYDYHSLYATFFSEKMTSGFRQMTNYNTVSYKKYDTSNLNHNTIISAPRIEDLPYTTHNALTLFSVESNGSATEKKGIEFQYTSKRFKNINTRFTFNGAWLQTIYYNSIPAYDNLGTPTINGIKHYQLGLYNKKDSYFRENLKSSLTADTYLPKLGLTTSLRFDMNWYYLSKNEPINGVPTHYITESGLKHKYTNNQINDPVLQGLVKTYKPSAFTSTKIPFSMHGHLKISKKFYEHFILSMYVNNLFTFYEDYEKNGVKISRRGNSNPYFGMEMNINF